MALFKLSSMIFMVTLILRLLVITSFRSSIIYSIKQLDIVLDVEGLVLSKTDTVVFLSGLML